MVELNPNKDFNDHLSDENIALVAEALVSGNEGLLTENIRNHVENCHKCKKDILSVYDLIRHDDISNKNTVSSFKNKVFHKKAVRSINIKIIKIAALLLLIISIGEIINYLAHSKNKVLIGSINPDSIQKHNSIGKNKPAATEPKAAQYIKQTASKDSLRKYKTAVHTAKSEFFENLIASNYRGGNIEVLSPSLKQQFEVNQSITFNFKGAEMTPISIKIYNNKGKKVFEKNNISSYSYTLSEKLSPGLYYWKLIMDNDLVYVGKFLVK
jgi:hypothetical protein